MMNLVMNLDPRALDPVEDEGEFRQHDSVVIVMMKVPAQGFA
mgnify:CR=1 FL=1